MTATEAAPPALAAGAPPTARRRRRPVPDWVLGVAGAITMLVVWDLAVRSGAVSDDSLPYPADMLARAGDLLVDPEFLRQTGHTLWAWFASLALASVVAVPLGLLMGYFATLYRPASTVVHAARSIPSTAFLPVAILLFGLGFQMKLALAVYAIFWPILLNAMYGVRDAEPQMLTAGRSMGWNRFRLLTRIVLPSAAPSIATGIRVASSIALIVVLSTELLGATTGIGTVITTYQQAQRPDFVYAGILLTGLLGVVVYYVFTFAERALLPWANAQRGGSR